MFELEILSPGLIILEWIDLLGTFKELFFEEIYNEEKNRILDSKSLEKMKKKFFLS